MLFLIHAYSTRIWKRQEGETSSVSAAAIEHGFQSPEGHSKLVIYGPWTLLWPCVLIWPCLEGVITFGFSHDALCELSAHPPTHHQPPRQPLITSSIHIICCQHLHGLD